MSSKDDEKKKKQKKQQSILEAQILAMIQSSMDAVMKTAIKEIFKDFK